jgi:hypothetical protein
MASRRRTAMGFPTVEGAGGKMGGRMDDMVNGKWARKAAVALTCFCLAAALTAGAQVSTLPTAGRLDTAHTLGAGGFMVSGGFIPLETRLPRLNGVPIEDDLNIGGVELPRAVLYESDGGLIPLTLGFGLTETTDLYLNGTVGTGTSQKRVQNFYGVPTDIYGAFAADGDMRFDRIYDQPIFDFGLGLKHQLKPDYGDGLPAVAVGVSGRFGYASDDFETFKDKTPADGFEDFGVEGYTAVTISAGELVQAHGRAAVSSSRKLGAQTYFGGGAEFALVPGQLLVSADFSTRRDIAGVEYRATSDRLTFGFHYFLSPTTSVQLMTNSSGHLTLSLAQIGEKSAGVSPSAPSLEQDLF